MCFWYLGFFSVFNVLDWNQSDIALLSMWGGIITVLFGIPFAGIMDAFGKHTLLYIMKEKAKRIQNIPI